MATTKKAADFITTDGKLAASNVEILNTVRQLAPADYKNRIPIATQGNVSQVLHSLNQYQPNWDVFWNIFIGRIGRSVINNRMGFVNPLKFAKKSALTYGTTVQEIQVNLIKARSYDPNGANVYGRDGREPDIHVNYHVQDRQDKYEINIPMEDVLRGAFEDGASIASLFNAAVGMPVESNEHDEMLLMLDLFKKVDALDGIYNVQTPQPTLKGTHSDNLEAATGFARAIRAMITNFGAYSTNYSYEGRNKGLATRGATPILVISGTADASMSVDMYQYAFNVENGKPPVDRVVVIPDEYFPVKDASAFLLDADVLQCYDTLGPIMLDSGLNPDNMSYNYFFHVWQILSMSRFLPLVMFSSRADTDIAVLDSTYTGVTLVDSDAQTASDVSVGDTIRLFAEVQGTNNPSQAVRYEIKAFTGKGRGKTLPSDVYVDSVGVLHIGETVHDLDKLVVTAICLADETLSADYTVTVGGGTAVTGVKVLVPASLPAGKTGTANVTFTPTDATDTTLNVYSVDPSIATVTPAESVEVGMSQFKVTAVGETGQSVDIVVIATGVSAGSDPITVVSTVTIA